MKRFAMATAAAVLLSYGSAYAQVGGISPGLSPLGMTSPLGIGPGSPVPPTHTPLGATGLGVAGTSPMITSDASTTTGPSAACAGFGGSIPQSSFGTLGSSYGGTGQVASSTTATSSVTGTGMSSGIGSASSNMGSSMSGMSSGTGTSAAGTSVSTAAFDGGGMAGTASGACGGSLAGSAAMPTGTGSSSVARVGIPMGASELGAGGLSPMFTVPAPVMALSPLAVPSSSSSLVPALAPLASSTATIPPAVTDPSVPALSPLGGTDTCQTTATGIPGTVGAGTVFGMPLTGSGFQSAIGRCLAAQ